MNSVQLRKPFALSTKHLKSFSNNTKLSVTKYFRHLMRLFLVLVASVKNPYLYLSILNSEFQFLTQNLPFYFNTLAKAQYLKNSVFKEKTQIFKTCAWLWSYIGFFGKTPYPNFDKLVLFYLT